MNHDRTALFSKTLDDVAPVGSVVVRGDVIDTRIWEALSAVLFGTTLAQALRRGRGRLAREIARRWGRWL